jgi:hypothetical protein
MTTVAECSTADEALIVQSLLAACGVAAYLPDERMVSYPPAVGCLHVQVADEDAESARSILANKAS